MKHLFLLLMTLIAFSHGQEKPTKKALTYFDVLPTHLRENLIEHITGFKHDDPYSTLNLVKNDSLSLASHVFFTFRTDQKAHETLHQFLMYGIRMYAENAVRYFVKCKAININTQNKDAQTPLSHAVIYGAIDCIKILLECPQIDINKADAEGITPLMAAIIHRGFNIEACVKMLLEQGNLDVNKQALNGYSALHYALKGSHKTEIIKLLLSHPAIDVNCQDNYGQTPLNLEISLLNKEMFPDHGYLKLLLKMPTIDIEKPDKNGKTPYQNSNCSAAKNVLKKALEKKRSKKRNE